MSVIFSAMSLFLWKNRKHFNCSLKGSFKCVPPGRRCAFFNWLLTRLNFSASTTDRHGKCTDDVVTEMCRIFVDMLQMSSMFFFCFCFHRLSSVVIFLNDIPYQAAFSVESLFCCNCLCLCELDQDITCHCWISCSCVCVCVFMSYHLIDVNLEAPSES